MKLAFKNIVKDDKMLSLAFFIDKTYIGKEDDSYEK